MLETSHYSAREIKVLMDSKDYKGLRDLLASIEVADISEIFDDLELSYSIALFRMAPKDRRTEVFSFLSFDKQQNMLARLPQQVVANILNEMEPVDRTQLLEDLPEDVRSKKISLLEPDERIMAWQLLSYPEDSIGRLMSPEFVAVNHNMTVIEALDHIRWNSEKIREIHIKPFLI